MASTRQKTLGYLRAVWLSQTSGTRKLESYVREAHKILKSVTDRSIERESGQILRVAGYREEDGAVMIHITADTPGEHTSVVPSATPGSAEVKIRTLPPPNDAEYMDGDAFVYISGNDICVCMSTLREAAVTSFFYAMFNKANLSSSAQHFLIMKVASADKMKLITSQRITEIQLRSTVFEATANYNRRKDQTHGIIAAAARQIKSLAGKPNDVSQDGLQVALIIKPNGRDKTHLTLAETRMEDLAIDLLKSQEEGDNFVIAMENGQKVTSDEIHIKSHSQITALGKSVARNEAWDALSIFYKNLIETGAVEQ